MHKNNIYSEVYSKFLIKAYGNTSRGHVNQLVGIPFLISELGKVLSHKILGQAVYSDLEVVTFKFRRGLTIKFYSR